MSQIVMKSLKETIPMMNSIFSNMQFDFVVANNSQLDTLLFANYSQRIVSPIVNVIVQGDVASQLELKQLADLILVNYSDKWKKLLEWFNLEYNPIANYSHKFTEKITNDANNH